MFVGRPQGTGRSTRFGTVEMEVLNAHLALGGEIGLPSMFAIMAVYSRRQPVANTTLQDTDIFVDR